MSLLTDAEIREAIAAAEIELDPLDEESIQPASYDLRLGNRALITRTQDIDTLKKRLEAHDDVPTEIDVADKKAISIPAGGFALIVTRERIRLSNQYAGHLGLRSYYARKGLLLLAGLQVDPGFAGYLVLGLANLSPRSVQLAHEDKIATLELLRLSRPAESAYSGMYAGQQTDPHIPPTDADYLRTIETLSVSDLTQALLRLSDNVSTLTRDVRYIWVPVGVAILIAVITRAL